MPMSEVVVRLRVALSLVMSERARALTAVRPNSYSKRRSLASAIPLIISSRLMFVCIRHFGFLTLVKGHRVAAFGFRRAILRAIGV